MEQQTLDLDGARPSVRRARREAERAAALLSEVTGLDVPVTLGLASEPDPDGALRVPPTWSARVRSVASRSARPVVEVDGAPHVVIDAHPIPARQLRTGEAAWRVVLARQQDGRCAVVVGTLRWAAARGPGGWRLGRTLSDARRRPTVATVPGVAWTVTPRTPSDDASVDASTDGSTFTPAKYADKSAIVAHPGTGQDRPGTARGNGQKD